MKNAVFDVAFNKVAIKEGGYANDPDDAGGETFCGICRKFHPNAKFWTIVDELKVKYKVSTLNKELKANKEVMKEIKAIYKSSYWDVFNLDLLSNQKFANQIFDSAVNIGVSATKKLLKNVLG